MNASKHMALRLAGFTLTAADAAGLAAFYERALGCRRLATGRFSEREGAGCSITLGLGAAVVDLLQFDRPGRPYPPRPSASDLIFQHFAIAVSDMGRAYGRLSSLPGWTPISTDGPQRLPASSGGVTAFKFRDPEGHPLELLAFPDGAAPAPWQGGGGDDPCLGIDHSALSVRDTARSIAFYQTLGFAVSARSINRGPEQARLDGLTDPVAEVVSLTLESRTPHVELLGYQPPAPAPDGPLHPNDIAATCLVFEAGDALGGETRSRPATRILDPDGHALILPAGWAP